MRTLSATLLAEQRQASRTPKVKLELYDYMVGARRLTWEHVYSGELAYLGTGSQDEKPHDMAIAGDGSITRVRTVSEGVQKRLRWQRITSPGPSSAWGTWPNYFSARENFYCAVCAHGSEVLIFYTHETNQYIYVKRSTDYGASYDGGTNIASTNTLYGASAAFKDNGDVCLAWIGSYPAGSLYLRAMRRLGGVWQAAQAHTQILTTGYGVGVYHDDGWNIIFSARLSGSTKYGLYQVTLSDAGAWGDLIEITSAPDGEGITLQNPFIDKPDAPLFFVVEKFTGSEAYQRPMYSSLAQGNAFSDAAWREPVPFNLSCEYGLSICHDANYAWLEMPTKVYRASLTSSPTDLSGDLLELNQVIRDGEGKLQVELDNHDGRHQSQRGYALSLDGENDYVTIPNGIVDLSGDCSVEAWLNISTDEETQNPRVVSLKDGDDDRFQMGYMGDGSSTPNGFYARLLGEVNTTHYSLLKGHWLHLVWTKNGGTQKWYVNGAEKETSPGGISADNSFSAVGGGLSTSSALTHGLIDEVRVYSRALSAAEVGQAYWGKHPTNGLVLYLPMDEGLGATTYDKSGEGNDGAITGASWINLSLNYRPEHSLSFDGSDDYVDCGHDASLDMTDAIAVEVWIKPANVAATQRVVSKQYNGTSTSASCYQLGLYGSQFRWAVGGVFDERSGTPVNGAWYHVVGTYDRVEAKLYVNGVEILSEAYTAAIRTSSEILSLGNTVYGATKVYYYPGLIREARIYNRALSAVEVQQCYQGSPPADGCVLNLPMNEGYGNTIYDHSGKGNDGTVYGATWSTLWKEKPGSELRLSIGYHTSEGDEYSEAGRYWVESWEYRRAPNRSTLILNCIDPWALARLWAARYQMRWNSDPLSPEKPVYEILKVVLARLGIKLSYKSRSSLITTFYPDFTISPGDRGDRVIRRLLSFVPDKLFFDGVTAYIVNPKQTDSSAYSYGGEHSILKISQGYNAPDINRAQVIGKDAVGLIAKDSFDWDEVQLLGDRLGVQADLNIDTLDKASERGLAVLNHLALSRHLGQLVIPPNCGQELWDVIDVTDAVLGLDGERYRVSGIELSFDPGKAAYLHQLTLGGA